MSFPDEQWILLKGRLNFLLHGDRIIVSLSKLGKKLDDPIWSSLMFQDQKQVFENVWIEKVEESWIYYIFEYFLLFAHRNHSNNHK